MRHRPEPALPAAPPTVPDDLQAAARAFFPTATAVVPIDGRDDLARVGSPAGMWCLRRWPDAAPAEAPRFVHETLARARAAGIAQVPMPAALPDGGTIWTLAGRRYSAHVWLPGAPAGRRAALGGRSARGADVPRAHALRRRVEGR